MQNDMNKLIQGHCVSMKINFGVAENWNGHTLFQDFPSPHLGSRSISQISDNAQNWQGIIALTKTVAQPLD